MKIAILTSPNQWFENYAKELSEKLNQSQVYTEHSQMKGGYDVVFILSYHKIIPKKYLELNRHNIVIHASLLPKGKGWAPLFWQVLEGEKKIPFSMFEAGEGVDDGKLYMVKNLDLSGYELNEELREKQANFTIKMCLEFVTNYEQYKTPKPQTGTESFYPKRDKKHSKLDINISLKDQFNLLRTVNNDEYPAFFELDGSRYVLKIELEKGGGVELIDFVDLTPLEKQMVMDWRNHNDIKEWMYSQEDISIESHLNYIGSLELLIEKQYLVVKQNGAYIGVVDFIDIGLTNDKQGYFGLYANPIQKTPGVGRILEEACIKYAFNLLGLKKLKLEVFSDNDAAINLYKKFKFKITDTKKINNKQILCMEKIIEQEGKK